MLETRPHDETWAWLRLQQGIGRTKARQRLAAAGSAQGACAGLPPPDPEQARSLQLSLEWLRASPARSLLALGDPDYPPALLNSPDPPPLLFLEGRREQLIRPALAVVGTRHPTPGGLELAAQFARELASSGWVVVSGLALGIDGAAHAAALKVGMSWAVLGCGLDRIYPPRHRELAGQLREQGLLISENPPGTPPLPGHFPARNRLIAGLSQGCLVIEAALRSGSLITARLAAEAGREVFALPGPVRSLQSQGCHELIQQGAKLVQSLQDIHAELSAPTGSPTPTTTPIERESSDPLLRALGHEVCDLDLLQARLGWRTPQLLSRLLELEMLGLVTRLPGDRFSRQG